MNNTARYFGALSREQIVPLFKAANEARQRMYESDEAEYSDTFNVESLDADQLAQLPERGIRREGYDYYMTPRAGCQTYPNYSHRTLSNLIESAALVNPTAFAPFLYTPYLGIYGSHAMQDNAPLTIAFYEAASEPKELFEVSGASHVSLYDIDEDVDRAVDKMDEFFQKHSA